MVGRGDGLEPAWEWRVARASGSPSCSRTSTGGRPGVGQHIDWNEEDDTGLPWTFADCATDPARIVPGAVVLAGRRDSLAVAEVVDRGEDGVVHLRPLPGSVRSNLHLLTDHE